MNEKPNTNSCQNFGTDALDVQWFWFLALGIGLIVGGLFAASASFFAALITVSIFGVVLAVAGIAQIVTSFWSKQWEGFFLHMLLGILYMVVGVLIVDNPYASAVGITLLLAAFFIITGIFRIVLSLQKRFMNWGWSLFSGFVSLLLGIVIWAHWPTDPAHCTWIIGLFVGIELIFAGIAWLMLSFAVRRDLSGFLGQTEGSTTHMTQTQKPIA